MTAGPDDLDTARAWADSRLWPKARGPFLAWYAAEQPDTPAGWDAFAAFSAAHPDDDDDAPHVAANCEHCGTHLCRQCAGRSIVDLNPARMGRAAGNGFEGLSA